MTPPPYRQRLEQLATHLESGKLGHDAFNFNFYHDRFEVCGTVGCALGECPTLWPDDWQLHGTRQANPSIAPHLPPITSACEWFGLDDEEAEHLFYPCEQKPILYGGKRLTVQATRIEVAANMREFIKRKYGEGVTNGKE